MNKLIDHKISYIKDYEMVSDVLDMKKIMQDYGYCPFYDYLKKYCKKNNIKMVNYGITAFDWRADLSYDQMDEIIKEGFKKYLLE